MRTILFTGKGGVGKTTVAAATAVRVAQRGARTLVMSTDSAHSLGDSFGVTLGDRPVEVAPGCRAAEPDAQRRLERSWGDIRGYLREVMEWAGVDSIEADELSLLPGVEEVVALTEIAAIRRRGDVDVLVVDCAPTAETIRLLSLPDVLAWYMARVFPAGRRLSRALGPVVSRVARVPIADDAVFASVERLYADLSAVRDILRDHRRSSARLVVNPEKMVVAEARRTATYLSLFGYRVDAVVANRVLPDALTDPWFDSWRASQAEHLETISTSFAPAQVLRAELAAGEIVGLDALGRFAASLYDDLDPSAVLATGDPLRVRSEHGRRILEVELPFATKDELDVAATADELFVRVGPYRRAILLPDSLHGREVVNVALTDGTLRVSFDR